MSNWRLESRKANHWKMFNDNDRTECQLCPRHCKTKPGQMGYCKVRGNVGGEYHTFNYGRSVAATEECIETEAVFHYAPGGRILSLGNIGCMFSCDYCQNWQTSQVKYLDDRVVHTYSPEQIVEMALANNIGVISWTYNDPVVWQEFVVDTSRLAQKAGIRTLYKSAFYIEKEPIAELIDCIDIFSVSLKSMSEEFYRKIARGHLQPILDGIKQVHAAKRHLEISQLLVQGLNEGEDDVRKTVDWIVKNVGDSVPLHFVAAHPAFKWTHVDRTPLSRLKTAYKIAKEAGIKYCYLGNVYEGGVSDTYCSSCKNLQVERFGLTSNVVGIDKAGKCTKCGYASPIKEPHHYQSHQRPSADSIKSQSESRFMWTDDVKSVHIVAKDKTSPITRLHVTHEPNGFVQAYKVGGTGVSRVIISRAGDNESGIRVNWEDKQPIEILPVLDRAHFPVQHAMKDSGLKMLETAPK